MSDNNKYIPYKLETHLTEICGEDPIYVNLLDSWHINKKTCLNLLSDVVFNYPHYTKHDISHSEAIITNIEMLLGEEAIRSLSPTDTWLLLNAAYLHDLGMVIDNKIIEQNWETQEFQDYLHGLENSNDSSLSESAKYINSLEKNLKDNKDVRAWPVRVRKAVTIIIADYYRSGHAKESQNYIQNMKNRLHIDLEYNGLIQHRLILLLSDIAYMHNESSMKIFELDYNTNGFNADYAHPRFVALMLRMGDLLDADNNRFNSVNEIIFGEIPHSSQNHLKKHMSTRHILITPDKIEYRADCAEAEVYRETRNFLTWLKEEVEFWALNWKDIMPENINGSAPKLGKCELLLKGVPDIQGLSDLRFSMSSEKAFEIIEGANIYDDNFIFLREVIQNALDACKIRMWRDISEGHYKSWIKNKVDSSLQPYDINQKVMNNYGVEINLTKYDKHNIKIIIKDNGIGISIPQFKKICNVGESYSNDKAKKNEISGMPKWLKPTAGFGIGLQSVFLVADYFEIYSKADNEEGIYARVESGRKKGYVQLSKSNKLKHQGTEIHVIISKELQYRYSYNSKTSEYIENKYDPFAYEIDPIYYRIWDELRENVNGTYFPIKLKFDGKEIDTIIGKEFEQLEEKPSDGRYNYSINNYGMKLWDNDTNTSFDIKLNEYNENYIEHFFFKGMSVKTDSIFRIKGFALKVDFYGLDTKKTLSLDRKRIRREAYNDIQIIIDNAFKFYKKKIKDLIFKENNIKDKNLYNQIYVLWCSYDLKEKKELLDNNKQIFNCITKTVRVIKNIDNRYSEDEMDFKNIMNDLNNVAFIYNIHDYEEHSSLHGDLVLKTNEIIQVLNNSESECKFKVIVVDRDFYALFKSEFCSNIQIIQKDDNIVYLKSYSDENKKLPGVLDENTKDSILRDLVVKNNSPDIIHEFYDGMLRRFILGIDEYPSILSREVPFGIGGDWHRSKGYIISPVTSIQWEKYALLSKEQFIESISNSEEFQRLVKYVYEHQLDKCNNSQEKIREEYIRLIGDIYDVCSK